MAAPGLAIEFSEVDGLAEVVGSYVDSVLLRIVAGEGEVDVGRKVIAAGSTCQHRFDKRVIHVQLRREAARISTHLAVLGELAVVL